MHYRLADDVRLRLESFGAVALHREGRATKYFNKAAAAVLCRCLQPRSSLDLFNSLSNNGAWSHSNLVEFLNKQESSGFLVQTDDPEVSRAEIYEAFGAPTAGEVLSAPLGVEIELTLKCMRSCRYCAYEAHPKAPTHGELTTDEWKHQLDKMYDSGVFFVRFTGGDPLTRIDFVEILEHADRLGFLITVGSDLTILPDSVVEALARARNLFAVQTTLDGSTPESADLLRGEGNFFSVINAIAKLKEAAVPIILGSVINARNCHEVEDIAQLAGSLGVDGYCVGPLFSAGRAQGSALLALLPSNTDLATAARGFKSAIDRRLVKPADPAWLLATDNISESALAEIWRDQGYLVRQPDALLRIDPFGRAYTSIKIKPKLGDSIYLGNIRDAHFLEFWHHSPDLKRLRSVPSESTYFGNTFDIRKMEELNYE